MKNILGKKEPISKQGRKSTKPGPTLDAFDDLDADLAYGMDYMDTEEAVTEGRQSKETEELNVTHDTEVLEKGGSNEEPVNAAGNIGVSTAFNISTASRPEVNKAKLKGVEIKDKKDAERPAISVLTLKPLPIIDPKDKGKWAVVDEGEGSEQPTEPQPTPSPTQPSLGDQTPVTDSSSSLDHTHSLSINLEGTGGSEGAQDQTPYDSPLSGAHTSDRAEGGLNLEELIVLCTNLSNRVLALETTKDAQAAEILKLKTRIKKLEKKCKPSISHHKA
ncbi:hypothetical protein Tco_1164852 [Tanacetum coccineum]